MLFNSLTFAVFFFTVLILHRAMPTWSARKYVLLISSYLFYASWSPPFVFLLMFSTCVDWWIAPRMQTTKSLGARKILLTLSLVSNLGLLGYFKYGEFLLQNFTTLAASFGIVYQAPPMNIILPVGISFYTFQSLSYTIDVYRRNITADWKFTDFALFVSFFPQLVAGPIVRASDFLPQLTTSRQTTRDQLGWGIILLIMGLFWKVVLADSVFAPVVDSIYKEPDMYGTPDVLAALLGFSGQIFYDFAGYSLCAIGAALCFGFVLPDNFRYPYAATGFSDFWRRWHISLSSWLRDYLYIPLGGNRQGRSRTLLNLSVTMLLGGLWHGASWLFIIWGGLHGLYLALESWYTRKTAKTTITATTVAPPKSVSLWVILTTFAVVTLTWIPFRAPDWKTAENVVFALFTVDQPPMLPSYQLISCYLLIGATVLLQIRFREHSPEQVFQKFSVSMQSLVLAVMMVAIFLCSGGDEHAFIYFQF